MFTTSLGDFQNQPLHDRIELFLILQYNNHQKNTVDAEFFEVI